MEYYYVMQYPSATVIRAQTRKDNGGMSSKGIQVWGHQEVYCKYLYFCCISRCYVVAHLYSECWGASTGLQSIQLDHVMKFTWL